MTFWSVFRELVAAYLPLVVAAALVLEVALWVTVGAFAVRWRRRRRST